MTCVPQQPEQAAEKPFFAVRDFTRRLNRLGKNSFVGPQRTSAAKASTDFVALTARLEAAPFQNADDIGLFPQPVKPPLISLYLRRGLKPRPFKTDPPIECFSSL